MKSLKVNKINKIFNNKRNNYFIFYLLFKYKLFIIFYYDNIREK